MSPDALVVGAGAAGALAATRLAAAGYAVTVLERRPLDEVGYPWADSVEAAAFERVGLARPTGAEYAGAIDHMALLGPDLAEILTVSPYRYVLTHRRPFGQRLLEEARRAGAVLRDRTPVTGPLVDGGRVVGVLAGSEAIRARLVIDASGAARVLARRLGPEPPARGHAIACYREQREAPGPRQGRLEVVAAPHGYTWIVRDEQGELDIGTGTLTSSPREVFDRLVARRPDLEGPVRYRGGGVVPLGTPPATLVHDGLMVLGDAGFQVLPTSGTGVGSALVSAQLAAEVAIGALAAGRTDREALWGYNTRYFHERGWRIAALDAVRRELQALSEPEVNFLFRRGLVPASTLSAAAHGEWRPPEPAALAAAFGGGWMRLDLLLRLGIRLALAERLAAHYQAFPAEPGDWPRWEKGARLLSSTLQ